VLVVAVYCIRDEDGSDKLVSECRDTDSDDGRHVIVTQVLGLNAEDEEADEGAEEARVGEPETVLRSHGPRSSQLGGSTPHEEIRTVAADLLADDGTDDHPEELETDLLGVEVEFRREELRDLDGEEHR